jgi:hypothetical protein
MVGPPSSWSSRDQEDERCREGFIEFRAWLPIAAYEYRSPAATTHQYRALFSSHVKPALTRRSF